MTAKEIIPKLCRMETVQLPPEFVDFPKLERQIKSHLNLLFDEYYLLVGHRKDGGTDLWFKDAPKKQRA